LTSLPLVMVEWYDAESEADWATENELEEWSGELSVATEVGWIYSQTDKIIVLVSAFFADGTFGNRTKIPVGMVKSIKKLRIADGCKRRAG
jgi:hypothetical protein